MTAPDLRAALHILTGALALSLRWLSAPSAALLATALVLHNVLVLPRLLPSVLRGERRRADQGIMTYPLGVLALIALFRERLDLAAAAWGILALGDGMASLVGRRFGRSLPWNSEKTWAGSITFILCGSAAGACLLWFVSRGQGRAWIDPGVALVMAGTAATAAAFAESLRARIDDNVRILAAAAATLALANALAPSRWTGA